LIDYYRCHFDHDKCKR